MTQHTPGPWVYQEDDNFISAGGDRIIDIDVKPRSIHVGIEARKANARLIAAAPDLLAALCHMRQVMDDLAAPLAERTEVIAHADSAIRKATGSAA